LRVYFRFLEDFGVYAIYSLFKGNLYRYCLTQSFEGSFDFFGAIIEFFSQLLAVNNEKAISNIHSIIMQNESDQDVINMIASLSSRQTVVE